MELYEAGERKEYQLLFLLFLLFIIIYSWLAQPPQSLTHYTSELCKTVNDFIHLPSLILLVFKTTLYPNPNPRPNPKPSPRSCERSINEMKRIFGIYTTSEGGLFDFQKVPLSKNFIFHFISFFIIFIFSPLYGSVILIGLCHDNYIMFILI